MLQKKFTKNVSFVNTNRFGSFFKRKKNKQRAGGFLTTFDQSKDLFSVEEHTFEAVGQNVRFRYLIGLEMTVNMSFLFIHQWKYYSLFGQNCYFLWCLRKKILLTCPTKILFVDQFFVFGQTYQVSKYFWFKQQLGQSSFGE